MRLPRADKTFVPLTMVLTGSNAHARKESTVLMRAETMIRFRRMEE